VVLAGQARPAILAHDTGRVVERVHHFFGGFVSARNKDVLASIVEQALRASSEARFAGEAARLDAVRRQDGRARKQVFAHRLYNAIGGERVAAGRRQYRVDHQRNLGARGNDLRDDAHIRRRRQYAGLERSNVDVGEHMLRLASHELGLDRRHAYHTARVLHGEAGDDRQRVTIERGDGEEIGLHAGAAGRIRRREREHHRWHGLLSGPIL
jgi:hypothetical protein